MAQLRSLHLMLATYPDCPEGAVLYSGTDARRIPFCPPPWTHRRRVRRRMGAMLHYSKWGVDGLRNGAPPGPESMSREKNAYDCPHV